MNLSWIKLQAELYSGSQVPIKDKLVQENLLWVEDQVEKKQFVIITTEEEEVLTII